MLSSLLPFLHLSNFVHEVFIIGSLSIKNICVCICVGVCTWLCVPKFMVARGWHLVSSLSFEMETPTSDVKGSSSLCLPSVRITDAAHHTQLLLDATALSSHFQTSTWSDVPSLPPLKNVYVFLFPCCFHNFILLFYFFLAFFHLTVFLLPFSGPSLYIIHLLFLHLH